MESADASRFKSLDDRSKIEFLAHFDGALKLEFANFLADLASDPDQDELLRIEAMKVIGLYKGAYDCSEIQKKILSIALCEREDDEVRVHALNSLAFLDVGAVEVNASRELVKSDEYILIKAAAFSLIAQHKHLLVAREALQAIQGDKEFGKAAVRELG
ncbi:hypothetical protein [uncultured Pseudomonas sp.]|uniref:hypothetical protein n=1 Tax=uncultured Pseudomonas sp. TaxID=114707 RepID=UPI0025CDAADC|nr:hypothetical protein [uncultured Pseudomonas sp.]